MSQFDHSSYLSPFAWRYGSTKMRHIWSEEYKRRLWRTIWVELARAQHKEGLVTKAELDDLIKHKDDIDILKAFEIEKEVHHDLMAEVKTYASQAKKGGGKIHLGATSMDIEDNTDTIRILESIDLIEPHVIKLLSSFKEKIETYKGFICMGYTHLQPAEPTTLGYRFSFYAQDLLSDLSYLRFVRTQIKGKGMKGAVGTSASYVALTSLQKAKDLENQIMKKLGISPVLIANQTSPRKIEFIVSSFLASLASSLYKFAFDVRIMQSPGFLEWQEPFGKKQIGSSAMPFKRNPWKSEQICSLGRLVFQLQSVPLYNASQMLLERTLDDSANRRVFLPEIFLAVESMLSSSINLVGGLIVNEKQVTKNLEKYGPFSSTEVILMEAVKRGGNRQTIHEILREYSLLSYKRISNGEENPLLSLIQNDTYISNLLNPMEIEKLMSLSTHIGLALKNTQLFLKQLRNELSN